MGNDRPDQEKSPAAADSELNPDLVETRTAPPRLETQVKDDFFSAPPDSARHSAGAADEAPTTIGDYDLLKTLGEGGMGVVYLARQRSADRLVALKVIRPERLSNLRLDQRMQVVERFQTEARAAAQLDHDNIVTIHDVGESNGQQYYSMRYVQGRSLADMLRDGPLDNRRAATYMQPVCRALQAAHSRGVLHRDLKPQNILVDDENDRALVADFGLAKLTEQDDSLTRDGDVMGTPQYMSPEQATDSANVNAQTDVYALGATLYHLLTGKPVFQAATTWETLRQVLDRTPVSPRTLNPSVDVDLDTICLKCLEKDPARRYPSAGELADELRRYLDGEPIRARPLGRLGRFWRLCRRNPVVAATSALAIATLIVALITVTYFLIQTRAAQRRSEQSFLKALDTVNTFFTRVSEETLLDQPGLQPLRRDLLQRARSFYEGFLAERSGDRSVQDLLAETHYRVGLITAEIESPDQALAHYDEAMSMQRELVSVEPNEARHIHALANTINAKAKALFRIESTDESLATFAESRRLREQLVKSDPQNEEYQRRLANTFMNLGIVYKKLEDLDQAKEFLRKAQEIRQQLLTRGGDDRPKVLRDLAKGYYTLGDLLDRTDDVPAAIESFDQAIAGFGELVQIEDTIDSRYFLSGALFGRAGLLEDEPAIGDYVRALEQLEPLTAQNPKVDRFHSMMLSCRVELAFCQSRLGRFDDALASLRAGRNTAERLARKDDSYLRDLIELLLELAKLEARDQPQLAMLKRYDQYLSEASESFPNAPTIQRLRDELARKLEAARNK